MKSIPLNEAAFWLINAVSVDGVLSDRERMLLQNFADMYGLDSRDLEIRSKDLAGKYPDEVILPGKYYIRGYDFEKFVVRSLCGSNGFRLIKWRGDKSVDGIFAEDDFKPDLMLSCDMITSGIKINVDFYIECKYRSAWNKVPTFEEKMLRRYAEISRQEKKIVLLVCGVGGSPSSPDHIYVAPVGDFLKKEKDFSKAEVSAENLKNYIFKLISDRIHRRK